MQIRSDTGSAVDLKDQIFDERLTIYYASLPVAVFAVIVNTLMIGYIMWSPERGALIATWMASTLAVAAYRGIAIIRFRRWIVGGFPGSRKSWYREALLGAALSGLAWGSAGYLFYDAQSALNQSVLAFVLAGMCAGSIVSMSAFAEASSAYIVLSLVPFLYRLLGEGQAQNTVMSVMVVMYMVLMVFFSRRVNSTVITGIEMKHLRSQAEEKIERQALYDDLTGLPNRRLLKDRLGQAVARAKRRDGQAALLFLDLDFFKRVNDSLGHTVGDQLLVEVAQRMSALLREEDTAARLGGDEFVALLTELDGDPEHVMSLVRRRGEELRRAIEAPMSILGNEVFVTVSIGVSMLPADTDRVEDLLKHADTAMYRAKEDGRNTLRFFVSDMQEALGRRMELERRLRLALDKNENLRLFLQPQYDRELKIRGAELLLRWMDEGEFVPPDTFICVAEDSGLIYRLGDWVIDEACRIGAELSSDVDPQTFSLAVNVSPRQFRQKDFSSKLLQAMQDNGLPAGFIELELTERLLIDDVDEAAAKMQELRDHGVRFSIDDFGTGYSSLRYLKSLPLDVLKIDQSFTGDPLSDLSDGSIVRAIISMAHSLELEVIAEGVETQASHDFLVAAGCRRFQGYLYSCPVPLVEFRALL